MCTLFYLICAFNICVSCITFFLGLAASHCSKDPPSLAYWLFASPQWGLFIKMATGCESQRWGTLGDPRPGRGHGDEWIDCVGSMRASPHPVDDYLLLSKSVPVICRYGHQMCSVFCGRRGLKNGQKPLKVIFLPSLACRDRSQLIDLDRGSGHRSCTCTVNPKNFFLLLLCQPFYISRVSLFLFFFSCIVALHKHWRMLDHLTESSVCFGDAPLAARFRSRRSCTWLWTFSPRTFVWF